MPSLTTLLSIVTFQADGVVRRFARVIASMLVGFLVVISIRNLVGVAKNVTLEECSWQV